MRFILTAAAMMLSLCGGAKGAEQSAQEHGGVGQGIICDTSAQAVRFLALRNEGSSIDNALEIVNREAKDERACGAALVAFRLEEELSPASLQQMDGKAVSIVKIVVIAISADGEHWSPILPKVQYTVLPAKGQDV
jgi:hypothetical protein